MNYLSDTQREVLIGTLSTLAQDLLNGASGGNLNDRECLLGILGAQSAIINGIIVLLKDSASKPTAAKEEK